MPMTTRGKLTVAQAALPAFVSTCSLCGTRAIFLVESERPAVEHRCGTAAVGPVWTLVERPAVSAWSAATIAERAAAFVDAGVRTDEQVRAQLLGAPALGIDPPAAFARSLPVVA